MFCDSNFATDKKECKWFGCYTWRDTTNMFVKNPEEFGTNQHRRRVCGIVNMRTRGKSCKYDAGINDHGAKYFCYS